MKSNVHFTRESRNLNLDFGHGHSSPREQLAEIERRKKFHIPKLKRKPFTESSSATKFLDQWLEPGNFNAVYPAKK